MLPTTSTPISHMPDWLTSLLHWLAMPEAGLGALFVVSFVSATLLPVGTDSAWPSMWMCTEEVMFTDRSAWRRRVRGRWAAWRP